MKKLPLGIQTFKNIIEENYLYIDKTEIINKLISDGGKYYFISRPRRFGKSLLISTLKEIFSGNKELFKGLWIYDKIEWKKYPIIHLDFSGISYEKPDSLRKSLGNRMIDLLQNNNLSVNPDKDYKDNFKDLIEKLSEKEKVVILIDEYDKPLVEFVDKSEVAIENRDILKNFYEVIKESDQYLKFSILTGVSKFSRVSVFSGLNNLRDITLSETFSTLFGYTEYELKHYFPEYLQSMAEKLKMEKETLYQEIKNWYNGYSWDGENFVYNPFSILYLFTEQQFNNYWFTSGTPTFLIKMINQYETDIKTLENLEVSASIFDSFDVNKMNVESLLFQTGYLTIKKVIIKSITRKKYILNYPNLEVKDSLLKNILADFINKSTSDVLVDKISESIEENNLDDFFIHLKSLFASIPSHLFIKNKEAYYHTIIYLVLTLVGVMIKVEVHTNKGRIDAVIETVENIYILEFKLSSPEKALEQIETMNYHEKYLGSGKSVILIGIGFDAGKRNIGNYLIKKLE